MADLLLSPDHALTSVEFSAEREGFLRDIAAQAGCMRSLQEDLLDVSQIEAGHLELDLAPVEVNTLLF